MHSPLETATEVLTEYADHYNTHRPHQSRGQRPPASEATATSPVADLAGTRRIRKRPVLAGLINEYHQAA
jgi:putative transposase